MCLWMSYFRSLKKGNYFTTEILIVTNHRHIRKFPRFFMNVKVKWPLHNKAAKVRKQTENLDTKFTNKRCTKSQVKCSQCNRN